MLGIRGRLGLVAVVGAGSALALAYGYGALVCLETCYAALAQLGLRALAAAAIFGVLALVAGLLPPTRGSFVAVAAAGATILGAWLLGTPPLCSRSRWPSSRSRPGS